MKNSNYNLFVFFSDDHYWIGAAKLQSVLKSVPLGDPYWVRTENFEAISPDDHIWQDNYPGFDCGCGTVGINGSMHGCPCDKKYAFICETEEFV